MLLSGTMQCQITTGIHIDSTNQGNRATVSLSVQIRVVQSETKFASSFTDMSDAEETGTCKILIYDICRSHTSVFKFSPRNLHIRDCYHKACPHRSHAVECVQRVLDWERDLAKSVKSIGFTKRGSREDHHALAQLYSDIFDFASTRKTSRPGNRARRRNI